MRTIRLTKEQFEKYLSFRRKQLMEINVSGDQFLASKNGDIKAATQAAIADIKDAGVNTVNNDTSVQFSADALRKQCGINESVYTKEQIEKLRLENAVGKSNASFSVSQFRPKK